MYWPDSDFVFGLIGALGVLAPALIALWRKLVGQTKILSVMFEDWQGEPGRPGVPPRYGVMERLESLEIDTRQLRRNGGAHLADKIEAIANDQVSKHERLDRIESVLANLANSQRDMRPALEQVIATLRVGEHRFELLDRALSQLQDGAT